MLDQIVMLLSSISILIGVFYAYWYRSDFAKKYIVVVAASLFLIRGLTALVLILSKEYLLEEFVLSIQIVMLPFLLVLLLNHFRKSQRILSISLLLFFVLRLVEMYLGIYI